MADDIDKRLRDDRFIGQEAMRASAASALTRLQAEAKALRDGWMPIETAPRDGTRFLAKTTFGVEMVRWCQSSGADYAPYDGWIGVEQDSTCLPPNWHREARNQPTHWMPLPADPEVTK